MMPNIMWPLIFSYMWILFSPLNFKLFISESTSNPSASQNIDNIHLINIYQKGD